MFLLIIKIVIGNDNSFKKTNKGRIFAETETSAFPPPPPFFPLLSCQKNSCENENYAQLTL